MSDSPAVFIVDPDPDSQACVTRIAVAMRVPAQCYTSAETFLKAQLGYPPGCLVTEFRLLGMNGIELQELLATDCLALPVIFVTTPRTTCTMLATRWGFLHLGRFSTEYK